MFVSLEVFSVWLIRVAVIVSSFFVISAIVNDKSAYYTTRKDSDGFFRRRPMTWPQYFRCLWETKDYVLFICILIWFVLAIPYLGSLIVH